MTILLHPTIIAVFFQRKRDENWHLLDKLIRNHKSKIVFTTRLLDCWEEAAGDDYRNELITEMLDERKADNITSKGETATCDEEFAHLAHNTTDLLLPFAIAETPQLKTIKNISFLEKIKKPNKDWLLFEIAANQPSGIVIRRNDCNRNSDIENIFKTLFNFSFSNIKIFDRLYENTYPNSFTYFASLRNKAHFYTRNKDRNAKKAFIRSDFGDRSKIFISNNNANTHERALVFANFILTSTDEFYNLTKEASSSNWSLIIQYSPEETRNFLAYCNEYTEFR